MQVHSRRKILPFETVGRVFSAYNVGHGFILNLPHEWGFYIGLIKSSKCHVATLKSQIASSERVWQKPGNTKNILVKKHKRRDVILLFAKKAEICCKIISNWKPQKSTVALKKYKFAKNQRRYFLSCVTPSSYYLSGVGQTVVFYLSMFSPRFLWFEVLNPVQVNQKFVATNS